MSTFYLARQAIFDVQLQTFAYDLLTRSGESETDIQSVPGLETIRMLASIFTETGLEKIVGENLAFIAITDDAFAEGAIEEMPRNNVVYEVRADQSTPARLNNDL
ncbi:MAG: hypothetical protein HUJ30_01810 [Gammaproteobacteria bacterium]|nr:hypothetical protein [Gammaproteobacteria bacterium]